jgi:K+-sensing histidine kinase KdpD
MGARPEMDPTAKIPAEIRNKLRALSHDLSNSVEAIMQASYLLAQCKLDENPKKWSEMIERAARDCVRINREIREVLRSG